MKPVSYLILVSLVCLAAVFAGCTGPQAPAAPDATQGQQAGAPSAAPAQTASAQDNLVPTPTDVVPDNNFVKVTVQEKVYDGKIPVVFDGGKGLYLVKSITVTLYRADGQVKTYDLGIKKGDTVELDGMRQTDRVVAHVYQMNGETYKVTDVLSPYRNK